MTLAIIVSVLTGTVIGFRFKIFLIVPVMVVAAIATAIVAIMQGQTFWLIASSVALSAAGLQIGYLCGSFALAQREATLPLPNAAADAYQTQSGFPVRVSDH